MIWTQRGTRTVTYDFTVYQQDMKSGFVQANTMLCSWLSLCRLMWYERLYIQHHRILFFSLQYSRALNPIHIIARYLVEETRRNPHLETTSNSEMADDFLSRILTEDNRVDSEVNAWCCVCLEPYGTLKERGETECEVRLPCNHTIGSICAWTNFKTNNKNECPQCRYVFFPADPNPDFEDDDMEDVTPSLPESRSVLDLSDDAMTESSDDDDESDPESPEDDTVPELFDEDAETFPDELTGCCVNLFGTEDAVTEVISVAEPIVDALKAADHNLTDGFSLDTIAATTIYIASHLLGRPRSSREVARQLRADEYLVSSLYTNIYDNKEDLVDLMETYDENGVLDDLIPLSWPPLSPEIADIQAWENSDEAGDDNDEVEDDSA